MARPSLDASSPSVRFAMMVPASLIERVNEFRHENRLPSISEALRQLVEEALTAREAQP